MRAALMPCSAAPAHTRADALGRWTCAGFPGPLFRVKAGDTFKLRLENNLGDEATDTSSVHNAFRQPNHTNVHTHGLHVSSEAPADDIFTLVAPGGASQYEYHIPDFHMAGTHWCVRAHSPAQGAPSRAALPACLAARSRPARSRAHRCAARAGSTRTTTARRPSRRVAAP